VLRVLPGVTVDVDDHESAARVRAMLRALQPIERDM